MFTVKVIESWGVLFKEIRSLFGNMRSLYDTCSKQYPEIFEYLVNDDVFTEDYFKTLTKKIKNNK